MRSNSTTIPPLNFGQEVPGICRIIMTEYDTNQALLTLLMGFLFGLVALYSSTKFKAFDSNSLYKNRKLSFQIVGYMLISGSIFMALGILFAK